MERLGGIKILVKNTPSVLYLPEALHPSNGDQASGLDPGAGDISLQIKPGFFSAAPGVGSKPISDARYHL
jgi:hypothetical protein